MLVGITHKYPDKPLKIEKSSNASTEIYKYTDTLKNVTEENATGKLISTFLVCLEKLLKVSCRV